MSEKSKMIAATLVTVSSEQIREAMDFLVGSRSSSVNLLVFNGQCLGIDTAKPNSTLAKPDIILPVSAAPAKRRPQRFDRQTIINIVAHAQKPISSFSISEALGLTTNDKAGRARVSYFLSTLKKSRALIHHANGTYSKPKTAAPKTASKTASKAAPKTAPKPSKVPPPNRITREKVTEEAVLDVITRLGQANSSQIAENLGIPPHDGSVRNKVSVVLGFLRNSNQIVPVGDAEENKHRGGVPYTLTTTTLAAAS